MIKEIGNFIMENSVTIGAIAGVLATALDPTNTISNIVIKVLNVTVKVTDILLTRKEVK